MTKRYDVLVVGAGMVGAAVGCALGRQGVRVALFDHALPSAFFPEQPPDLRVSALNPATEGFLRDIGAWPLMEAMRMCPFRTYGCLGKIYVNHGQARTCSTGPIRLCLTVATCLQISLVSLLRIV